MPGAQPCSSSLPWEGAHCQRGNQHYGVKGCSSGNQVCCPLPTLGLCRALLSQLGLFALK